MGQEYEVLFAKNGREALDLFAEHQPAAVITDRSMPDISGVELCRLIRRDFQGFHSHLILLTSNSDKEQVVQGLAAGADDYLTKPFHPGELVARIAVGRRIVDPAWYNQTAEIPLTTIYTPPKWGTFRISIVLSHVH